MMNGPLVGPHLHLWTTSVTGVEFANVVYEDDTDASLAFLTFAKAISKYNPEQPLLTIELIMDSLKECPGVYVGAPGLLVVLSKCDGGCVSPSWN